MIKTTKITRSARQSGVTLIELLVSITIGLVILIGIGTAYISSTNSTRQRENQSELNEPARVVMRLLKHDIGSAGYVDVFDLGAVAAITPTYPQAAALFIPGNDGLLNLYQRAPEATPLGTPLSQFFPGLMPVFGCDGAMNGTPNAISTAAGTAVLTCGAASATRHALQVAYQAAPSGAPTPNAKVSLLAPDSTTGEGRDCNQQALTGPAGAPPPREAKFVINRYFVRASATDGINELYCAGSGNATEQPLARGVEEFVLRYQVAQPGVVSGVFVAGVFVEAIAAGGSAAQYVSAAVVNASAIGWAGVSAIEVCMVSATSTTGGAAATGTTVLQTTRPTCTRDATGNYSANIARVVGDTRLWKRFTTVVSLRNAIYSSPN